MADSHAEEEPINLPSILVLTVIVGAFGIVIYLLLFKRKSDNDAQESIGDYENLEKKDIVRNIAKKNQNISKKKPGKEINTNNRLLLSSLKGHTGVVLDAEFSSNGKYLASCSEDRTIRLWNVKDFTLKDHKYTRVNVEYDHATSISFSPDSRAFIIGLALAKTVRVYKIHKKKDEGTSSISVTQESDFPIEHKSEIISAGVSSNGKFIMTADKDTQIIIWSLKGEVLEKIDSLLVYNSYADISPCGKLVAACGFTSDVKMWHVGFHKNGDFNQVVKSLELKGHSAGVLSFSFTADSKRIATISKDRNWKVWDVDVDYLKGQEAYLLHTGSVHSTNLDHTTTRIAISHDYFTVAVSVGPSIYLYNTNTEELGESLEDVHQGDITVLSWHSESKQLISVGGTDRSIKIWHNPVGVKAFLQDLQEKLPKAKNQSMKDRIEQQIDESRKYLALLEN